MSITLPMGWTQPKYRFLQRVKYKRELRDGSFVEEFGVIMGMSYEVKRRGSDLALGWWYEVILDEDSPGWDPHSTDPQPEDEIELLQD